MKKNMTNKKTLAEELVQYRGWLYERNLSMRDVMNRAMAVAAGLIGGALSIAVWSLAFMLFGEVVRTGDWGWVIAGMAASGFALLVTSGVAWFVWATWTDEI